MSQLQWMLAAMGAAVVVFGFLGLLWKAFSWLQDIRHAVENVNRELEPNGRSGGRMRELIDSLRESNGTEIDRLTALENRSQNHTEKLDAHGVSLADHGQKLDRLIEAVDRLPCDPAKPGCPVA